MDVYNLQFAWGLTRQKIFSYLQFGIFILIGILLVGWKRFGEVVFAGKT